MSELNYKELQEQGVFDTPYKAFEYMQNQHKKIKELELINLDSELRFDASKECIDELQKRVDEIVNEIKIVELKILKCEPNSIMGVHWSSKLAGLKRKLKNAK